jgi:hypothetical protein
MLLGCLHPSEQLTTVPSTAALVPDELRGEIVLVLAAMALNQAPEDRLLLGLKGTMSEEELIDS